ncbi:imidazole glycerol phosphate synthase subunit HisH [Engelhardtia mirabilis]|uniref:Imidazole glycerol phosphate synthase subunit HisH n=1 Tax=Engelhardtia mirabilis TaxID=2528011 RepID=A0A518BI57_9BACT|nr:Imidazole glycerol phosphate synthase subunit HisH [Planctomycetes bacterium Pla133]QDV00949.1 Imidazole glycerol phosphate synthase subunit HisH [Planctomycetes bacterium Pla86]
MNDSNEPEASPPVVDLVRTGVANVASLRAAFARLGIGLRVAETAQEVRDAVALILPGVGSFAAGMEQLRLAELDQALADRIRAGAPTLAVCLGLQLLATTSEEARGYRGLGLLDLRVNRFPDGVLRPQIGWNRIQADPDCELLQTGWAAFANGYRLTERPVGWRVAWADHGGPYIAALERGAVLGCQFHPELSGAFGAALIERWLERSSVRRRTASAALCGGDS